MSCVDTFIRKMYTEINIRIFGCTESKHSEPRIYSDDSLSGVMDLICVKIRLKGIGEKFLGDLSIGDLSCCDAYNPFFPDTDVFKKEKSMGIDRKSHLPLYIQLKERLKRKILDDVYTIGDLIPSEKELMAHYEVGRATVREAMKLLAAEGYLDKRQGVGTFVTRPHKSDGFKPLITLAYALNNSNLHPRNKVLFTGYGRLNDAEKAQTRFAEDEGQKISRLRLLEEDPVMVEHFYHHRDFMERTKDRNYEDSIGKMLVDYLDLKINKLYQETEIIEADRELAFILNLGEDKQLLRHRRWMDVEGFEGCYQYYELFVPVAYSGYPFQNLM